MVERMAAVGLDFISVTLVLQLVNCTDFKRIAADCTNEVTIECEPLYLLTATGN